MEEAYNYVMQRLEQQGDYTFLPEGVLREMLQKLIALDEDFMRQSGVDEGAVYDDDDALEYLHAGMSAAFSAYGMYMRKLSEDYLDYNEDYLESTGGIEWN